MTEYGFWPVFSHIRPESLNLVLVRENFGKKPHSVIIYIVIVQCHMLIFLSPYAGVYTERHLTKDLQVFY